MTLSDSVDHQILFDELWLRCPELSDGEAIEAVLAKARMQGLSELAVCALRAETLRLAGQPEEAWKHLTELKSFDARHRQLESPRVLVRAFHCLGFLERWLGQFDAAAEAFLGALECDPAHISSLHALQYTPVTDACLEQLTARLQQISFPTRNQQSRARFLLADWFYRLGQTEDSLIFSFQAAKLSCSERERTNLDHLNLPSLPEALIIGPPKCGTTSLAGWLAQHSSVYMHPSKELHYFDNHWNRGPSWYRCQFPCFRQENAGILRFEATPNYLQMPHVPQRISALMPHVKLIAIFRNPLQRAISAYHHIQRQAGIREHLDHVIASELKELVCLSSEQLEDFGWHQTNCLFGSFYSLHLRKWQRLFGEHQLLLLQLESLIAHPQEHWQIILEFLELPQQDCPGPLPSQNRMPGPADELSIDLRQRANQMLKRESDFWEQLTCF